MQNVQQQQQRVSWSEYFASTRIALVLLGLVLVLATIHAIVYNSKLPEQVPSHMNGSGDVDDWQPRSSMIATYMGIVWGISLLMFLLSLCIARVPARCINAPNKEEILRTPGGQAFLVGLVGRFLYIQGCCVILLIATAFQLLFMAALKEIGEQTRSTTFYIALAGFLVCNFSNVFYLLYTLHNFRTGSRGPARTQNEIFRDAYMRV